MITSSKFFIKSFFNIEEEQQQERYYGPWTLTPTPLAQDKLIKNRRKKGFLSLSNPRHKNQSRRYNISNLKDYQNMKEEIKGQTSTFRLPAIQQSRTLEPPDVSKNYKVEKMASINFDGGLNFVKRKMNSVKETPVRNRCRSKNSQDNLTFEVYHRCLAAAQKKRRVDPFKVRQEISFS